MDNLLSNIGDIKSYIEILELAEYNLIFQLQSTKYQLPFETISYDYDKLSINELIEGIEAFKNIANNCGASTSSGEFNFDDFSKEIRMLKDGIEMLKALQKKIDILIIQDNIDIHHIKFPQVINRY